MEKYKKYKDSGFEFIKDIPELWSIYRLKNISDVEISNVDKKSIEEEQTVNLCNYVDVYYNDKITEKINFMEATAKPEQIKKFSLKEGDVLLTKDSETPDDIAVPAWVEKDLEGVLCGYHLALIRPKDSVNGRYLYYSLTSSGFRDQFYSNANGVTRFGLSKDAIRNALFFIPTLEEQYQIANFLDKKTSEIDALIIDKEKLITLLEEKRQAIITEAVTKGLNPNVKMRDSGIEWIGEIPGHWELKKLKYNCYMKGRIGWQGLKQSEFIEEGPYLITGMNFRNGKINWSEVYHITEERYNEAPEIQLKIGDVLMTKDGTIGKLLYIDYLPGKASLNSHLLVMRPKNNDFLPKYLYYSLDAEYFKKYVEQVKTGTTFFGITQEAVNNFTMILPTIEEQREIVEFIDNKLKNIDDVKDFILDQIEKLKEYRQSLIIEAVTGKIDVRDYFIENTFNTGG